MKLFLTGLFCCVLGALSAQPQFTIDSSTFNCGFVKLGRYKKKVLFKNTGNQPLILVNVKSSRGNCVVNYSKEPIEPGEESSLTFIMSATYVGPFAASVTVNWNHPEYSKRSKPLMFKGKVIYHRTTVSLNQKVFKLQKMEFFDVDTLRFKVCNTGDQDLYIGMNNHPECDLLYIHQSVKMGSNSYRRRGCLPGDTIQVEMVFCNLLGRLGTFSKDIFFAYNNKDSFRITVHFDYSTGPGRELIAAGRERYRYANDLLVEKKEYSGHSCNRIDSYESGRLTSKMQYYYASRPPDVKRYVNGRVVKDD